MISEGDMPVGYRLDLATPATLRIVDIDDVKMQIFAELESGQLWFPVRTEDEHGNKRTVRGHTLYDLMMRHFGSSVVFIAGFWPEGDNLRVFLEEYMRGATPEVAARSTWSGRQAERHGFPRVEFDWCAWPEIPQTLGVRFCRKEIVK